jgi:hypothetical protein
MHFALDDIPMTVEEELKSHLRLRYLHCCEMLYRPFLFRLFTETPGTMAFAHVTSAPFLDYAKKCLKILVSYSLSLIPNLRHAGTWYTTRHALLAATLLMGASTIRQIVDIVPDRANDAVRAAQVLLERWAPESRSTQRALELLHEMKTEVMRINRGTLF